MSRCLLCGLHGGACCYVCCSLTYGLLTCASSAWRTPPTLHASAAAPCRLPDHVAAAVLEQLPSIACSPEELQAAVQHPSVTRLLLQHVQQQLESAEGGDSTEMRMWEIHALQAVFAEAARLGDVPLLDYFALRVQRREQRREQRDLQWEVQHQQQQQLLLQPVQQAWWQDSDYANSTAELGILAAVQSGSLATLQLAAPPAAGQVASPAQELLRLVYRDLQSVWMCVYQAVAQRQPAAVQLLLAGCPRLPDPVGLLLQCSLKHYQPAVFQMLLEHTVLPTEPFRIGRLVEHACSADAPDAVQLLLERSELLPSNAQLLKAVEAASLGCVQALLAAAGGPLELPPPPQGGMYLAPAAEPWRAGYECPVLAVLLQNLNPVRRANTPVPELVESVGMCASSCARKHAIPLV